MTDERPPCAPCSPGEYLAEELEARGWTPLDLASRMALASTPVHLLSVQMLLAVKDKGLIVDHETSRLLGAALGVSDGLFENLSKSWSRSP